MKLTDVLGQFKEVPNFIYKSVNKSWSYIANLGYESLNYLNSLKDISLNFVWDLTKVPTLISEKCQSVWDQVYGTSTSGGGKKEKMPIDEETARAEALAAEAARAEALAKEAGTKAQTKIAAVFRGFVTRRALKKQAEAQTKIAAVFRGFMTRRALKKQAEAEIKERAVKLVSMYHEELVVYADELAKENGIDSKKQLNLLKKEIKKYGKLYGITKLSLNTAPNYKLGR